MSEERALSPADAIPASDSPDHVVARFIARMLARFAVRPDDPPPSSLLLAEAALRYALASSTATRPAQLAVLGPTQAGKSTIVNLLLGQAAAAVSPLAGFTVHATGFWLPAEPRDERWLAPVFPGWARGMPGDLRREDLAAYGLTVVNTTVATSLFDSQASPLSPSVIWDTPDFDSLAARQYARGVLEIAGLADVFLLVLSKEKYSDLAVWRLLELLAPLRRPLVICLNKLTPDARAPILRSLRERLSGRGHLWGDVPIVPVPHDPDLIEGKWAARHALADPLHAALAPLLQRAAGNRPAPVRALLAAHWDAWLAPLRSEHAARAAWRDLVDEAGERFIAAYRRDYLDHPQRYDAFRLAALELSRLLELPKIGGLVNRLRAVVLAPVRGAWKVAQGWWNAQRPPATPVHSLGVEAGVLRDTLDHLLTELLCTVSRRAVADIPGAAVWRDLAQRLQRDEHRLRSDFARVIEAHHETVQQEVRATAGQLYAELERHPIRLNALRAARATIDAGYLVLAIKTGGLSALEAVWAPATFALTSLLMEGAADVELGRAERKLRERQLAAVRSEFVAARLRPALSALADDAGDIVVPGLSESDTSAAEAAFAAWEKDDA